MIRNHAAAARELADLVVLITEPSTPRPTKENAEALARRLAIRYINKTGAER